MPEFGHSLSLQISQSSRVGDVDADVALVLHPRERTPVGVDAAVEALHAFLELVLEGLRRHVVGVAVEILAERADRRVAEARHRVGAADRRGTEARVLERRREDRDRVVVGLRQPLVTVRPGRIDAQVELGAQRGIDIRAKRLALERFGIDPLVAFAGSPIESRNARANAGILIGPISFSRSPLTKKRTASEAAGDVGAVRVTMTAVRAARARGPSSG